MAALPSTIFPRSLLSDAAVLLVSGRAERASSLGPSLDAASGGRLRLVTSVDLQDAANRASAFGATVVLLELPEEKEQRRRLVLHLTSERLFPGLPLVVVDTRPGVDELVRRQLFSAGAVDFLPGWPEGAELAVRLLTHSRGPMAERERDAARAELQRARAELVTAQGDLVRVSKADPVTGLPGAERLADFLDNEWRRARRNGSALSLVLIEVEIQRPAEAEGVLQAVAPAMRGTLRRGGDLLACVRNGCFAAVLPEVGHEGAGVVARSLLRAARSARPAVTFKVGTATARPKDPASASPSALMSSAEAALVRRAD